MRRSASWMPAVPRALPRRDRAGRGWPFPRRGARAARRTRVSGESAEVAIAHVQALALRASALCRSLVEITCSRSVAPRGSVQRRVSSALLRPRRELARARDPAAPRERLSRRGCSGIGGRLPTTCRTAPSGVLAQRRRPDFARLAHADRDELGPDARASHGAVAPVSEPARTPVLSFAPSSDRLSLATRRLAVAPLAESPAAGYFSSRDLVSFNSVP